MKNIFTFAILLFAFFSFAQSVTIDGEAKITQMTNDNSINDVVVRTADGTLGTRSAQSMLPMEGDTARTLSTDLELANFMCDCGSDLPPYLIKQLMDAGYSNQALIAAGVPITKLRDALPVVDRDGNVYEYIAINGTKWMTSNLKTTSYNNGTSIDNIEDPGEWNKTNTNEDAAFCYYNNDPSNSNIYGILYNYYAMDSTTNDGRNVCPVGWQIPSKEDFEELIMAIDPSGATSFNIAGIDARATGSDYWDTQFFEGLDVVGLNILGAGRRQTDGDFSDQKEKAQFWTKTTASGGIANNARIDHTGSGFYSGLASKRDGASVRCIRKE